MQLYTCDVRACSPLKLFFFSFLSSLVEAGREGGAISSESTSHIGSVDPGIENCNVDASGSALQSMNNHFYIYSGWKKKLLMQPQCWWMGIANYTHVYEYLGAQRFLHMGSCGGSKHMWVSWGDIWTTPVGLHLPSICLHFQREILWDNPYNPE